MLNIALQAESPSPQPSPRKSGAREQVSGVAEWRVTIRTV